MNTAILLGAGSSLAAGYPSTQELTKRVLSGCGIKNNGDGSYDLYSETIRPEKAQAVNCMVRKIYAEAESYYASYAKRPTNYEDLFYLAKQALDEKSGEMENPAIHSFVMKLKADMLPLIKELLKDETNYTNLLTKTCDYIISVVHQNLLKPSTEKKQLNLIESICSCENFSVTSISTLCHDTHVEKFLKKADIKISDGFSEPKPNGRYWNGDFSACEKIPFLKLHGSINWHGLKTDPDSFYGEKIWTPLENQSSVGVQLPCGRRAYPNPAPLLLIGTFNKMAEYSSGIFRELHYHFRSTINKASQLIICGYSFGDKGINNEIIEWVYGCRKRQLVIIHPDPGNLLTNARGAIQKHWGDWLTNGALITIKKRFEDIDFEDFTCVSGAN